MNKLVTAMTASLIIMLVLSSSCGAPEPTPEPPAAFELTVPDYEVTTVGGIDYVEIPGGEILLEEEGRPRLPYYTTSIDYAEGYRVQDVVLEERAGLTTTTGLVLPMVRLTPEPDFSIEMKTGWYPEEDYSWRLWENADGSTTLAIAVYPFYYNPETTDVKSYSNYQFEIEYIVSSVEITSLYGDRDSYVPGDEVTLDIRLHNLGEMQDIIVSTMIKQHGSDVTVAGLPLRSLKELAGNASLTVEWDSSGTEEGYYYAEVTLFDTSGNTLDKETEGIFMQVS